MAIRPLDPGISSGGGSSGGGSSGGGSLNMKSKSVAVNTSVTAADSGKIITTTASGITLTLAAVAGLGDGFTLVVKNTSTGDITVATSGSDKIDGASTFVVPANEVALIQGDSTALQVVVLSTLKMARLPIFQDNGTWNAVSVMEEQVVDLHTVIDTTTSKSNIAYGCGLYVVMGTSAKVFTSPDLVTWTSRTLALSEGQAKYIGSNGTSFMVFERSTTNVHKSSDGVTWTKVTALPGTLPIEAPPIYVGGLWLIKASATQYYTSTDGAVWTTRNYPTAVAGALYQVGNSVWVAGGTSTDAVAYYTTDGINWTVANLPYIKSTFVGSPYFGQDGYLYWMYNSQQLYRTADGITWSTVGPTPPFSGANWASSALVNLNGVWTYYNSSTQRFSVYTNGTWVTRGTPSNLVFQPALGGYSKWGGNNGHFINGKILYIVNNGVYELKTGTSGSYGLFVK